MSPFAQHAAGGRDAVHHLVVDRDAERRRKHPAADRVALERRQRALLARQLLGDAIELGRGDAGTHRGAQLGQHLGHDDVGARA